MFKKVFVVDADAKPLLPTRPSRARKLLNSGKAKVFRMNPFTIQLKRVIDNPVGSFTLGVDDGAKTVGLALMNQHTNEVVFAGELQLRQDVSRKIEERRNYRRSRRSRKLRYRKARFNNRIGSKLAPSIKYRKDCILRVLKDLSKLIKIAKVKVEEVCFNHFKYKYGKFFSLVEIGKTYLRNQISKQYQYDNTFGYITKPQRLLLDLPKTHYNDAIAIASNTNNLKYNYGNNYYVKPRRTKIWENNPTKKHTEHKGFKHYDLVKAEHRKRGIVIGNVRSLKKLQLTLRTKFDDNFSVSYNKTKLLERPGGLVYNY